MVAKVRITATMPDKEQTTQITNSSEKYYNFVLLRFKYIYIMHVIHENFKADSSVIDTRDPYFRNNSLNRSSGKTLNDDKKASEAVHSLAKR